MKSGRPTSCQWTIFMSTVCFIAFSFTVPIMLVDYFAAGCIVDYDTVYSKQLPDGSYVWYHGETCHQTFIHTPEGKRRQTK